MIRFARSMRNVQLSLGLAVIGLWTGLAHTGDADPPKSRLGQVVPAFSLTDASGTERSLTQLAGRSATVVVFVSIECPMSNSYLEPLTELARDYGPKEVTLLLVNSNDQETSSQIAAHVQEYKVAVPVLKDSDHAVADWFGAAVTPEAFVLDAGRMVRYRGRIDDRYVARLKRRERVSRQDLREALDEVLAGKPVTHPQTEALGCPIVRATPSRKASASGTVTFNRDVMPILQTHCQTCHRPGQAAPFSLPTYRQAAKWASDIQLVTEKRIMPPWKAEPGFGEFRNERRLTDSEIATIAAWVADGCPEGHPADLPPPREFPSGGWQLGEPDLVLSMSEEYEIHASGRDIYRHFVIPTGLTEDRWVTATEFRSGNPRVAHHAIFFTDTTGRARRLDADDPQPGFGRRLGFMPREHIGFWAVGTEPAPLPDGVGMRLPKGADVVLQVHYHPSGKPERDRSSLGIYFAKKPVEKEFFFLPVIGWRFQWPAGDDHIPVTGRLVLPADIHAISVFPHMHLLGKKFKLTATLPDESTTPLVYIRDWDFNWQQFYTYQSPVALPKGTRIEVEALYDNSENNPVNPHQPPQTVWLGEQTTNEMCIGAIGCIADNESDVDRLLPFRGRRPRATAAKTQ